ncbi:hypothetical protein PIB30_010447 [Stylosanthes scabra]|uniref:Uncharacterized protein n=1 Tax=Stylosanthes scabra TaxID=79078 RepID=A0ABU6Y7A4_9FABA|nr:hypothetical protein [Stylosanthes scabra]
MPDSAPNQLSYTRVGFRVLFVVLGSGRVRVVAGGVVSESESEIDNCIYDGLIKVVLSAIAMIHGDLAAANHLYQQHKTAIFIYLVAKICYEIAKKAPRPNTLTTILFHASGVIAFEALLWLIISGQFLRFFIINVPISLVTFFCYYHSIHELVTMCYGEIFGFTEQQDSVED